jgi:uncharacterized membrane protein YcfT
MNSRIVSSIWSIAAILESAHVNTGWTAIDEFAHRFVYFYSGYIFSGYVFALAEHVRQKPKLACAGLAVWAIIDAALVYAGVSEWPVISLILGFAGAFAIVTIATLLARRELLQGIRYCGEHSITIYLGFFLPMAVTRTLLLKTGIIGDIGLVSLIVTAVGVLGALVMWWALRGTPLKFLYERPDMFWIAPKKPVRPALQPAE